MGGFILMGVIKGFIQKGTKGYQGLTEGEGGGGGGGGLSY